MDWNRHWELWKERFLVPLDDPGSRLFHLNIVIAVILAVIWLCFSEQGLSRKSLRNTFFRKKYWWNRSTRVDYQIYLINSLLKVFLIIPFLDFTFFISREVAEGLVHLTGDFANLPSRSLYILLFTVGAFVWDDFLRFFQHFLMHQNKFLWRIHSTHHSAKVLTPITLFRNHPLESAIAALRNSLSLGVATGIFVYLFSAQLSLWTLLGVNVFGFLFNLLGANLRHSQVPLEFPPWVEKIFISPKQHQIHHSIAREHFDKNYGVSLAIWDRLFGTIIYSKQTGKLRFGIPERSQQSLKKEFFLK